MKLIKIIRGGSLSKWLFKADNGDKYDSRIEVYDSEHDNAEMIYYSDYVNTDHTVNYQGGKLAPGNYFAIIGMHKGKYEAPKIFRLIGKPIKRLPKIRNEFSLTLGERTLPSEIPNPKHVDRNIICCVNIHKGGKEWDWSHGCITIYKENWNRFIENFELDEICRVKLIEVKPKKRSVA